MMQRVELMIAWRYLRTRSRESFVSVITAFSLLGTALGVATLIIVMSVMHGYEIELVNRILGLNGHITISSPNRNLQQYQELVQKVRQIPGVKYAAPTVQGQSMANAKGISQGVMVRGMLPQDIMDKPLLAASLLEGSWQQMEAPVMPPVTPGNEETAHKGEPGVIIGKVLAESLQVGLGDHIKLIAAELDVTALGNVPRMKTYQVVGVFDVGMYEYNAGLILMPLAAAQLFFRYPNAASDIEIMATSINAITQIKAGLTGLTPYPIKVTDWMLSNQNLVHALKVERNVMFLILAMIILVAAFNTISGLVMLVKEKTKSIAILRTLGMSRGAVIRIFMITGSLIGISGTVVGVFLGVLITLNLSRVQHALESLTGTTLFDPVIYFLTKLPAELQIESVVSISAVAMALSVLATLYPAWRASRLLPAEALRYE